MLRYKGGEVMNKRPNLFSHGTSELSQDAFICWLTEWRNRSIKKLINAYMKLV